MVVDTFGRAFGGRPRRTGALANFSGQPSFERSGAVSGSKPRAVGPSLGCQVRPPPTEDLMTEVLGVRVDGEYGHTPDRAVKLSA